MTDVLHQATMIITKLTRAGFIAYFAGGWVRDFVMGHPSEDIDIATNATPPQIMDLFPNTVLVGLAFGVVIVVIEGHQFEVATFRKDLRYLDGRHPEGIELSTPLEDALRRDFTINGMFYDPIERVIHDYIHGREDIRRGVIRTIGNPHERFFEDRLRMLRAFRFSARFGFHIDPDTQQAITENASKLFPAVAMERVWQEFHKMVAYPAFGQAMVEMHRLGLLDVIFPEIEHLHLKDLRHRVAVYTHFPKEAPTILYVFELVSHLPLEKKIEIAKRLKTTHKEIKLLEFFEEVDQSVKLEEREVNLQQWVHLFAHSECWMVLEVMAARYSARERQEFLERYRGRFQLLERQIIRVQQGKPLVSADFLRQRGVLPSRRMGLLLKEAERIAIQDKDHDPEQVFAKLMRTPLWNQGQ
jgi:poly(A) polymerase